MSVLDCLPPHRVRTQRHGIDGEALSLLGQNTKAVPRFLRGIMSDPQFRRVVLQWFAKGSSVRRRMMMS